MAVEQVKEPLDQKTYAHWFAILGVALMLCTLWAILQEFYLRRTYVDQQAGFRDAAGEAVSKQLAEAKERYEQAQQSPEYKAAQQRLEQAQAKYKSAEVQAQEARFRDEMRKAESELRDVRRKLQDIRGTYQEAVYEFETHDSRDAESTATKLDPVVDKLSEQMLELDKRRKEFKNKIAELHAPVTQAADELEKFRSEVVTLQRRQDAVLSTPTEIRQVYNEELKLVDRCQTCHLGADVPGLEMLPKEQRQYRTHPAVTDPVTGQKVDLLKVHDVNKIGCVSCHGGQGYATAKPEQAHGEVHYWLTPLLRKDDKYAPGANQATCYRCHETAVRLPGADVLMRGKKLVKEYGCWGCHKIKGIGEEEDRLGEAQLDLKKIQEAFDKTKADYLAKVEAGKVDFDKAPKRADTDAYNAAQLKLEQAQHRVDELALEVRRIGPSLKGVKEKVYPGWLPIWIEYPKKWRPTTKMPNFFPHRDPGFYRLETADDIKKQTEEEVQAISAFVWQNSDGEAPAAPEAAPAPNDVEQGKALFESVGCRACHRLGEEEPINPGNTFGPELSRIGEKARLSWLARWIEYPRHMMSDAKMPSLRLTPEQSRQIASFLVTLKKAEPPPAPAWIEDKGLAEKGKTLVERYGCFGCHAIKGMEVGKGKVGTELSGHGSKLVEEFDFGLHEEEFKAEGRFSRQGWISKKLDSPRFFDQGRYRKPIDRLKMPQFDLAPDEVAAITTFILGNTAQEAHPGYKARPDEKKAAMLEGWRLVDKFNCTGCHQIKGQGGYILPLYTAKPDDKVFAPPILRDEGLKVQSEWLIGFLKAPSQLRPFLKIKMPTFDMSEAEAISLAKFFAALDDAEYPFHYRPEKILEGAELTAATTMFTSFQCLKCHQAGAQELSPEEAATKAPDLFLASRRLKADWVLRWLHNPDVLQPDTRMPSFWASGQSQAPHILGGDAEKQMEVMRDFVLRLREYGVKPLPVVTAPAGGSGDFYDDEEEEEEEESESKPATPAATATPETTAPVAPSVPAVPSQTLPAGQPVHPSDSGARPAAGPPPIETAPAGPEPVTTGP